MPNRRLLVVDTNVWVSILLWPSPTLSRVLDRVAGEFEVIASRATLAELAATLGKPKFAAKMSRRETQLGLGAMMRQMTMVDVTDVVADCRDPADNKFLELALSGKANIILSGDNDLLALDPWRSCRILTPRQFLEIG